MQSIKSDLLSIKELKIYVFDNKYSDIQNLLDIININNDLYHFLSNPLLNSKKKYFFLYIIFNFDNFFSKILQFINFKNKSSITTTFMKLWNTKKKWIQINVITAIPLSYSMEEYILIFFKKYKNIKFFLEKKVNNNIIGGLILCIEDKELDSSLEETIRKLKIQLKNYI
jgi:F-type H+-transporting ATPase subunit delta